MSEIKRFDTIDSIKCGELRRYFSEFKQVNKILEEGNLGKMHFEASYLDVISEEEPEVKYIELYYQIKYLIEEMKVGCNKILEFGESKYDNHKNLNFDLSEDLKYFDEEIGDFIYKYLLNKNKYDSVSIFLSSDIEGSKEVEYKISKRMNDADIYYVLTRLLSNLDEISMISDYEINIKTK